MLAHLSVDAVRSLVQERTFGLTQQDMQMLRTDPRKGVRELAEKLERETEAKRLELARLSDLLTQERLLWEQGYTRVLGIDEVGRGPLAGPVTVAGVIWRPGVLVEGIDDSKALTPKKRMELDPLIRSQALAYAIASRDSSFIDEYGIVAAIQSCQREVIAALNPDYLLLDAFALPDCPVPQLAIIKGDSKCMSIAAASIIAKVQRDGLMTALDHSFPGYGFVSNKGYGCKVHYAALLSMGPCAIHRRSYLGFMEQAREQ